MKYNQYKEYNEDTDFWNNRHITISSTKGYEWKMNSLTASNMLQYFSAAYKLSFWHICFDNMEQFTINTADYNIGEIVLYGCTSFEDDRNKKVFDLVDRIASHKHILSLLQSIRFSSAAYMSYQKWESVHKKLDSLGISL